jgi:hypothetical protein
MFVFVLRLHFPSPDKSNFIYFTGLADRQGLSRRKWKEEMVRKIRSQEDPRMSQQKSRPVSKKSASVTQVHYHINFDQRPWL